MKGHALFVHGAGEGAHEADRRLAASLRDELGTAYEVRCPKMPDEDSPEVGAWKDRISEELAAMDGGVVLVGHSVGALILLKYLSEEEPEKPVVGLFLVAAPYAGAGGWEVGEGRCGRTSRRPSPKDCRCSSTTAATTTWSPSDTWRFTRRGSRGPPSESSTAADTNSATTSPRSPGTSRG